MPTTHNFGAIGVAALAIVAFIGGAYTAQHHTRATIRVTGTGSVNATPDTATFTVDVVTTGPSNAAAFAANNARTRAVTGATRRDGVRSSGLSTSSLTLAPLTNSAGATTGYQADNQLTVTTHDIGGLGRLLTDVTLAGGNASQLSGVNFSLTRTSTALARARVNAVVAAHQAASEIARASGDSLGGVVSIVDQENTSPVVWPSPVVFSATSAHAGSTPVSAGVQTVTVTVEVVYSLG